MCAFLPLTLSLSLSLSLSIYLSSHCTGPSLKVAIMGPNVTVVANSVTLFCTVNNEALVDSYQWNVLHPYIGSLDTIGTGGSVLQLNSISTFRSTFTCVVTDVFGTEHSSDTFSLEIQG